MAGSSTRSGGGGGGGLPQMPHPGPAIASASYICQLAVEVVQNKMASQHLKQACH